MGFGLLRSSRVSRVVVDGILVLLFTLLGFLVMGYHAGIEDDGVRSDGAGLNYPR